MTKQNPFEKFWEKWDSFFEYHRKDGHVSFYSMKGDEWEKFKTEFSALCETHAKKADGHSKARGKEFNRQKETVDPWANSAVWDQMWYQSGKRDAFRLVKPKQQKTWQEELDDSMRKAFQKQRNRKIIDSITMKKEKKQQ